MRKGGFSALNPPCGGSRGGDVCQRFLLAHIVPTAWGEPARPGFPPRGKRERGSSDFLAAAGSSRSRSANAGHPAGLLCARSSSTFLSIPIPQPICRSRSFRFPEFVPRSMTQPLVMPGFSIAQSFAAPPTPLPCFYPHSKWAAIGPVHVGVRSKAQVYHHGDGPGLLGAAIYLAISEGS